MANKVDTHELITPSPSQFAACDGLAIRTGDAFALVGRVLIGWIFFTGGWAKLTGIAGFAGYLTALKAPSPQYLAWLGAAVEFLFGLALILGIATRYASLLGLLFVFVATALAHRYWEYPPAQQTAQYISFMKNVAIFGGMLLLFVTGAGRFSVDGWMRKKG